MSAGEIETLREKIAALEREIRELKRVAHSHTAEKNHAREMAETRMKQMMNSIAEKTKVEAEAAVLREALEAEAARRAVAAGDQPGDWRFHLWPEAREAIGLKAGQDLLRELKMLREASKGGKKPV